MAASPNPEREHSLPKSESEKEKDVKAPNLIERAAEEIEAVFHTEKDVQAKSPRHHHETHGTSDDIDESTPIDDVKGPNLFERVKEEVEALVQAIHPKHKDSENKSSPES